MQSENPNSKPLAFQEKAPTQKTDVCAPAPHQVSRGWIELPVDFWGQQVFLFIGYRDEMKEDYGRYFCGRDAETNVIEDWLRRHPANDNHTDGDTFGDSGMIFIRKDRFHLGNLDDLAILSHECLHAANGILRDVGVMGDDNVEVLAYTQEFIFKGLMKEIMSGKITPIGGRLEPDIDLMSLFGDTQKGDPE